jgi:type IV secretion system protein VirB5
MTSNVERVEWLPVGAALIIVSALLFFSSGAYASGVPVIDAASIAQGQANQAESIAKALEQIDQLKSQLGQMKKQYSAITGSRSLGSLANNPVFRNYLPEDWKKVYDDIARGGYKGLTGEARKIRDASQVYDMCARLIEAQRAHCEQNSARGAIEKAFALEAYDKATARWDQIALLMKAINGTTDPKAIGELQARIQTEQAALQNEQTKLDLYRMVADAEARIAEQKAIEREAKVWGSKGRGIDVEPVRFGGAR